MKKPKFATDVQSWFKKAEEDLRWGQYVAGGQFYAQTCFVAQQVVEKALKAFILYTGNVSPKIHSLPRLLDICRQQDRDFEKLKEQAEILDKYYAPTRYPDVMVAEEYTQLKAAEALDLAREILEFVKRKIKFD